jgi:cellobiose phosphorylase
LTADRLHFAPCLPADWQGFQLHYRYRQTVYHITVRRGSGPEGGTTVAVDGVAQADRSIRVVDDHREHQVEVNLQQNLVESLRHVER